MCHIRIAFVAVKIETKDFVDPQIIVFFCQSFQHDNLLKKATNEITQLKKIFTTISGQIVEEKKIYVGNMNPQTSSVDLSEHFKKYGTILNVFKNDRARYGFIEYADKSMMRAALDARPHKLGGMNVIVSETHKRRKVDKENAEPFLLQKPKFESRRTRRYSPY